MEVTVEYNKIAIVNPFEAYLKYWGLEPDYPAHNLQGSLGDIIIQYFRQTNPVSSPSRISISRSDFIPYLDEFGCAHIPEEYILDRDLFPYDAIVYTMLEEKNSGRVNSFVPWYTNNYSGFAEYPTRIDGDPNEVKRLESLLRNVVSTNPEIEDVTPTTDIGLMRIVGSLISKVSAFFSNSSRGGNSFTYKDVKPRGMSYQQATGILTQLAEGQSCVSRISNSLENGLVKYLRHKLSQKLITHRGLYDKSGTPLLHPVCARCVMKGVCPISREYVDSKLTEKEDQLTVAYYKYESRLSEFIARQIELGGGVFEFDYS